MAIFKDETCFYKFSKNHIDNFRYIKSKDQSDFIESIRIYAKNKTEVIEKDGILYRSQIGYDTQKFFHEDEYVYDEAIPFDKTRMSPDPQYVKEGRINPKGIAYFYCSNEINTALSEARPWLNQYVSLAYFQVIKNLNLVDFIYDKKIKYYKNGVTDDKIDEYVWNKIAYSFSQPVSRNDDFLTYSVTQLISEIIKSEGYDGLAYKSLLNTGYNICLFSSENLDYKKSVLYDTEKVSFDFFEFKCYPPV